MDFGLWTLDFGLNTLDFGFLDLDFGLWTLNFWLWTLDLDFGLWTLDFGLWNITDVLEFSSTPMDLGLETLHFVLWNITDVLEFSSTLMEQRTLDARGVLNIKIGNYLFLGSIQRLIEQAWKSGRRCAIENIFINVYIMPFYDKFGKYRTLWGFIS